MTAGSDFAPPQQSSQAERKLVPEEGAQKEKPCSRASATRPCCGWIRWYATFPTYKLTMATCDRRTLGKAEWYNPGGSVKDRAAANIVVEARSAGKLAPGKILLDSTSGNTGIAYAMLGAALGFPVTLCVPEMFPSNASGILQAYGANILYTDPGEGSDGAIKIAQQLAERIRPLLLRRPVFERSQLARAL